MIALSSRFYYWFLYLFYVVLAPAGSVVAVATVACGWVENFTKKEPWLPILILGGFFSTAAVAIGVCAVRSMRKFADRVVLVPGSGEISANYRGSLEINPVQEIANVQFVQMGGLAFVELTFKSGHAYRLIPFFEEYQEIKRYGVHAWWKSKLRAAKISSGDEGVKEMGTKKHP